MINPLVESAAAITCGCGLGLIIAIMLPRFLDKIFWRFTQ